MTSVLTPHGGGPGSEGPADPGGAGHEGGDPFEPARTSRPRQRSWGSTILVGLFVALLVAAAGSLIRLPYAILLPGPASNVLGDGTHQDGQSGEVIVIEGAKTYPTTGSLDFTTVRVRGGPANPVNVWDALRGWVNPTQDVYPVDSIFPPQVTAEQVQQQNEAEMVDSQQEATAVALEAAGYPVTQQVSVGAVSPNAPSGDAFHVGDVLVSIGGTPVTDSDAARAAIQKVTPGDSVAVVVKRDGKNLTISAKTGKAEDGRTVLGIILKIDFTFPFKVTIDPGQVGGPSAGLMFSLGIYDKLTPQPLTGGHNIAGTGTIDSEGTVGPIGGIRQKVVGARDQGATVFLAPAANCPDLQDAVPDGLTVVKVTTFDDAKASLTKIAAGTTTGLPAC